MSNQDLNAAPAKPVTRPKPFWLAVLAVVMITVPFFAWQQTWFGRSLSDEKVGEYLNEQEKPRRIQHALAQISDRIVTGDGTVERWYPQVMALARHPDIAIRTTAAWVMGQDNRSQGFHDTLLEMLADTNLMVRRNAALALVRFADSAGRGELVRMLMPYGVRAPEQGTVRMELEPGRDVGSGTLLARVIPAGGQAIEVRSPFSGKIGRVYAADDGRIGKGDALVTLNPEESQVWEALRGLSLVGIADDLAAVEQYTRAQVNVEDRVRQQAALTAQAIRTRSEPSPNR